MTALSDEIDAMIAEHGGRVRDALNIAMARRDALRAELADVRAQWQADVGSAIARAQTAEARARAMELERDAARAEAARLRELIKDAADGAGYAVTFGNMLVKGETIDNCGDPDAVSYLLGEAKAIEDKLRAALRESNDGNE